MRHCLLLRSQPRTEKDMEKSRYCHILLLHQSLTVNTIEYLLRLSVHRYCIASLANFSTQPDNPPFLLSIDLDLLTIQIASEFFKTSLDYFPSPCLHSCLGATPIYLSPRLSSANLLPGQRIYVEYGKSNEN